MRRKTLGIVHQLVIGIAMAGVFVVAIEGLHNGGLSWDVQTDDGNFSISLREGKDRLRVKSRGKIEYEDERRVASMETGARLRVEEKLEGVAHLLVVTPDDSGHPVYNYKVDGSEQSFDAEAETWFAGVLIRLYRRAGVDAEDRARRIGEQGVNALLEEVAFIPGDFIASVYLSQALAQAEVDELPAVLDEVRESVESDYHMALLLDDIQASSLWQQKVAEAFYGAASEISSDHHLRHVLGELLDQEDGDQSETVQMILKLAVDEIQSDHALAELAVQLAERLQGQNSYVLPSGLEDLLSALNFDHSLNRSLHAFTEILPESDEDQTLLLSSAGQMSSDYQIAQFLIHYAERKADVGASRTDIGEAPLPEKTFEVLAGIRSGHDSVRAADALLPILPAPQLPRLVESVQADGDYQKRVFLERVLEHHAGAAPKVEAVHAMIESMHGEYDRNQITAALMEAESQSWGAESSGAESSDAESSGAESSGEVPVTEAPTPDSSDVGSGDLENLNSGEEDVEANDDESKSPTETTMVQNTEVHP